MPWKSQAQVAWGHSPEGEKALGGPAKVAEWDAASKGAKLPVKVPHVTRGLPSKGGKGNKRGH